MTKFIVCMCVCIYTRANVVKAEFSYSHFLIPALEVNPALLLLLVFSFLILFVRPSPLEQCEKNRAVTRTYPRMRIIFILVCEN